MKNFFLLVVILLSSCVTQQKFTIPPRLNTEVNQKNVDALEKFQGNYVSISQSFGFWDNTEASREEEVSGGYTTIRNLFSGEEIFMPAKMQVLNDKGKPVFIDEEALTTPVLSEVTGTTKVGKVTKEIFVTFLLQALDSLQKSYTIPFSLKERKKLLSFKEDFNSQAWRVKSFNKNAKVDKTTGLVFVKKKGEIFYFFKGIDEKIHPISLKKIKGERGIGRYFLKLLRFSDLNNSKKEVLEIDKDVRVEKSTGNIFVKKNGEIFYFFQDGSGAIHPISENYKNVFLGKFFLQEIQKNKKVKYKAVSKTLGK